MAVEIEKKYRLGDGDVGRVEDALALAAADLIGEEFEENTIYRGGILDEAGAILRIRVIDGKGILTYKRRIKNDSAIKHQVEHETAFANVEEMREIVANLGFKPRLIYEKIRKTWRLGAAAIMLDELPFGMFMEIEGSIAEIGEVETALGIEDLAVENETYPRLTARLGTKVGDVIETRFPAK